MTSSKQRGHFRQMASFGECKLSELVARRSPAGELTRGQLTSVTLRQGGTIINKWSQISNQAHKMAPPKRPARVQTAPARARRSAPLQLILSVALGLLLAHSSALSGDVTNSAAGHSNSSPNSNSPQNQHNQPAELSRSQKLLQPPTSSSASALVASKPLAASSSNSESVSINLIPIDQPMLSSVEVGPTSPASIARTMSAAQTAANTIVRQDDSYDGSRVNLRSGQMTQMSHSADSGHNGNNSPGASNQHESNDDLASQSQQQQQQQAVGDEDFGEPLAQFYANQNEPATGPVSTQQTGGNVESQQQLVETAAHPVGKQSATRQLERRFGLFKKGHFQQQPQHFGAPASYLANPFMSECERCLAGFNQQQTAELQLEPVPAPSPPPPPPLQPMPAATLPPPPSMGHFPMQPFGPFKNKFFTKFPFLMKGSGGGGGVSAFEHLHSPLLAAPALTSYSAASPAHYWPLPAASVHTYTGHHHHHSHPNPHRPAAAMSQALFVRPAPAYNCVQAAPTMLAAATSTSSQSEAVPLLSQTKSSALTSGGGGSTKQHHYAHQQQQVQSGYAKK